jgi:predicted TIM-barrel fold metal-dependent hydrolase
MTIDIHGHVTSPELFRRFPMPPSLADIDGMVEQKAAVGIATTIVGSPVGAGTMVPFPGLDNYAQPVDRLEAFHDWVGETVRARPGRLRAYVYVNPYGDDDELDRAAKRLQQVEFVGLVVNTSVRGRFLDDERADGFFALAAERRVPVLLHPPAEPVGASALGDLGLIEHAGRPCDVTLGVAAILFAGWLEKYPDLVLIASNAGGAISLLAEKLDLAYARAAGPPAGRRPGPAPGPPPGARPGPPPGARPGRAAPPNRPRLTTAPSELLRRLYVDTATPSLQALLAALATFGAGHLLFGTDSPPLTTPLGHALELIRRLPGPPEHRRAITDDNARALFGLPPATDGGDGGN